MHGLLEVLLLLLIARACGEAAHRLGQPASVGELVSGIALGAIAAALGGGLPFLTALVEPPALDLLANVGIFFLVLLAGIEMEPKRIARRSLSGFAVALGGVLLPLGAGIALAWWALPASDQRPAQALAIGVVLSVTAVPVVVKVFADLRVLRSRVAETVLTAAVFDDVIGLVLLAILTAFAQTGEAPELATLVLLLGKVALFFAITVALGVHVYPLVHRRVSAMDAAALEFSAMICAALAYALLAELLGMHWIMGGFMAGLFFERARVGAQAYLSLRLIVVAITSGVLGPLFFLSIGLQVDLRAFADAPLFLAALIVVGMLSKAIGGGLPARLSGMPARDSLLVGVAMTSRGAVGLVILDVVAKSGLFVPPPGADGVLANLFSALVIMVVVSTLLMPILLSWLWPRTASGKPLS